MTPGKFLRHGPHLVACLLALQVLLRPALVHAQSVNDGFNLGLNDAVYDVATQADGRILVAGQFTSLAGTNRNYLARLKVDGSFDSQFQPTVGAFPANDIGRAVAVAVQADGKILVGGEVIFADTTTGGTGGYVIAGVGRLHPDGTTDTNFIPRLAPGPFGGAWSVWHLAAQPDGKVVIAGDFTTSSGGINPASASARTNLARLNPDGTVDASFDPRNTGSIYNLLLQRDGKILVAGFFTSMGGHAITNLARFNPDGSFDETFQPVIGGAVTGLGQQVDGRIIAGGTFTTPGSPAHTNLVRLNPDGTTDETFQAALDGYGFRVAVQPDGKILVGGTFISLNGQARTNLARLLPDGSLDTPFNPPANGMVRTLAVQGDGKILAGGEFTTLSGQTRHRLGRLYGDGSLDMTMTRFSTNTVRSMALLPDGGLLIGSETYTVNGTLLGGTIRLRPDGLLDTNFNTGEPHTPLALAVQDDGRILVGGNFSSFRGLPRTNLVRIFPNGTVDESFPSVTNDLVSCLALQPDGKIVVGTRRASSPNNGGRVQRLNADGTVDPGFMPQTTFFFVAAMALQADGKILVGGSFFPFGGLLPRFYIARLEANGALDPSFDAGAGGAVRAIVVQPDGKILVGGEFTAMGGQPRNRLARLNANGTLDLAFNPDVDAAVSAMGLHANGWIVLGGDFSQVSAQPREGLARLLVDGTLDASYALSGFSTTFRGVKTILIQTDGKIVAGGQFNSGIFTDQRMNLVRLREGSPALQSLQLGTNGSSVIWTRGGSSPEVSCAFFEQSPDGTNYTPLGSATRGSGYWQIAALNLPSGENFYMRARGRKSSGSGLVESVAQFWRLPPPYLNNVQVLGDGQLQFSFTNTNATAFSVLASTNAAAPLAQWESLGAPVSVGGGTYQFTDPGATNHARRFYQLRSP